MNTIRHISAIFTLLLATLLSPAQETGFVTLHGHISDSETSESLFFSSVNLRGTNISNISNSDGHFSLKLPETTAPDAVIQISHLGYRTESVRVSEFAGATSDKPLKIKLSAVPLSLDPATVRTIDPNVLVVSAFYKIRDNYPTTPVGMTAFYREMIRKGTVKYLALNEAVIDIDKASYTGIPSDKIGIYKGRGSTNYDNTDTLVVKLQGGILTAFELDQVKNPFAGVTLHELTNTYRYEMDGVETYDGYSFFKVMFEPKNPDREEILFKGHIYIETETLAIGRVEMELDCKEREEEAARIFVRKWPQNTNFYANEAKYVSSYKCYDGKWYYDYCRADLSLSTRKRASLFRNNFTVTLEMAVTDHKTEGIAIEDVSRVRFKDVLSDRVADFADDNFWGEYNIIEPDQTIDAAIRKIVRNLGNRR